MWLELTTSKYSTKSEILGMGIIFKRSLNPDSHFQALQHYHTCLLTSPANDLTELRDHPWEPGEVKEGDHSPLGSPESVMEAQFL